ncbi:MAG: carbohydrate-binding protein [Ruminococcaceae bacterium]|nr:carbohydrate-binding protein [Oscillospiraceae bacterium]
MKKDLVFRIISCILLLSMLAATFVGCSKKKDETPKETQPEATEAPTEDVTEPVEEEEEEELDLRHPANRRYEYSDTIPLSQAAAAEGMVLLKNEDEVLPLIYDENVALFGNAVMNLVDGAAGSANVNNSHTVSLLEGMLEKQAEEKISVNEQMAVAYAQIENYVPTLEELKEARKESNVAVYTVTRNSKDGSDRDDVLGDYYLSADEIKMIESIIEAGFDDVIVVVNSGGIIDTTKMLSYPEVKAILFAWLPGEYGGAAISDILVGDITPSGKLTDTLAKRYKDYPSYTTSSDKKFTDYKEDIYVGYRYFETFDAGYKTVNFEFGFGLSYTEFEFSDAEFNFEGDILTVTCKITNTGKYTGKETAQLYFSAPQGELGKPAKELCAFAKTRTLRPGESQTIAMSVDINDFASYDDTGKVQKSAYVLEAGEYELYLGSSIRHAQQSGLGCMFTQDETVVVEQLSEQLPARLLKQRLLANGEYENIYREYEIEELTAKSEWKSVEAPADTVTLADVKDDASLMPAFVAQFTPLELVRMIYAHSAKVTGGEGTTEPMSKYGVPYINTADGTAGLRLSQSCTEYPVQTALGCTWNVELLEKVGKAIAKEAKEKQVHMWLAPAANIHRDPLGGANFEFFSEDPYLSGILASAIVKGVQKEGVAACVKHLVGNEKELNRQGNDSRMSERALREIYLRPFQITVEEADPWMMMTSYNLINGVKASASYSLLTEIVRNEWGYEGVICTDRKVNTHLINELLAGSDLKLPTGERDETVKAFEEGKLTRALLEEHAARVLELVIKTAEVKDETIEISGTANSVFKSVDFAQKSDGIAVEDCKDEGGTQNTGGNSKDQYLVYNLTVRRAMEYDVAVRVASPDGAGAFDFYIDNKKVASYDNSTATGDWQKWATAENKVRISLPAGIHTLKIVFTEDGLNFNTLTFTPVPAEAE